MLVGLIDDEGTAVPGRKRGVCHHPMRNEKANVGGRGENLQYSRRLDRGLKVNEYISGRRGPDRQLRRVVGYRLWGENDRINGVADSRMGIGRQ